VFGREEYALVLDFLPYGKSGEARREPIAQLLGESYFTLLEAVPKEGIELKQGQRVYVGKEERKEIDRIKGRILFSDLTSVAKTQAESVILGLVKEREKQFVDFLNKAGAINIRSHYLEHLPSIGKKHLSGLLDERSKKLFESFEDVQKRVPHLGNVREIFVERILHELSGNAKYYLFTKPVRREDA